MSAYRALTLGSRFPIVNCKLFSASKEIHSYRTLFKRVSMRTCCRSTDETHHRIPQEGVIPNLQCNKRNPKIHQKKQKGNWAKPAKEKEKLSFDFFGPGSLATILFSVV